jgi:hypothetical protein
VRLFEFLITHAQLPLSPQAQETIAAAGKHSGQAGRVYAGWLAANWQVARDQVMNVQDRLQQELGGTQPERFFIAGMSCILVGAAIAKLLGLAEFDVTAMRRYLKDAFLKLRAERTVSLPIGGGVFDVEKLLADFISDHVGERMITDIYARAGVGQTPPVVRSMPTKYAGSRLAVHIAYKDRLMRLDKNVWRAWLYKHGYSPSDVTGELERRWQARQSRVLMGAGTHYATGRVDIIELALTHPELDCYTYGYQDTP